MSQQPPTLQICTPLAWELQSTAPDDAIWSQTDEANTHLLHLHFVLDNRSRDALAEEPEILKPEMQRLETKVDYLIDLIGHMALNQMQLPNATEVALSGTALSWHTRQPAPPVGSLIKVELYLPPIFTQALQLFVTVTRLIPENNSGCIIHGVMDQRAAGFYQLLDRIIFRHHRRDIARRKQN